jgi:hypothetical protein
MTEALAVLVLFALAWWVASAAHRLTAWRRERRAA